MTCLDMAVRCMEKGMRRSLGECWFWREGILSVRILIVHNVFNALQTWTGLRHRFTLWPWLPVLGCMDGYFLVMRWSIDLVNHHVTRLWGVSLCRESQANLCSEWPSRPMYLYGQLFDWSSFVYGAHASHLLYARYRLWVCVCVAWNGFDHAKHHVNTWCMSGSSVWAALFNLWDAEQYGWIEVARKDINDSYPSAVLSSWSTLLTLALIIAALCALVGSTLASKPTGLFIEQGHSIEFLSVDNTCIHTYIHTHKHIHTSIHTHIHTYIEAYIHRYLHT